MRFLSALLTLGLWGATVSSQAGDRSPSACLAEVKYLIESHLPASAIQAYVEAEDLRFALSAEDLVALKEAGAEEGLLLFLIERSRRAGEPVELEGATVVYEAKGVRALRKKEVSGREVLIVTNLDENGLRLDRPPDLPEVSPAEAAEPAPVSEEPPAVEASPDLTPPPAPAPPPAPVPLERSLERRVYVGPFYQFIPSNVPGPGSPWSPVFQILPTLWGWPLVSIYPHFALTPIYAYYPFYELRGSYGFSGLRSCYACLR